MMGNVNKTDKLDAKGLAKLPHLDSLPTVWLPPGEIRDERELHRTRMALSKLRTALKNRIHATLAKYGITSTEHSDIFAGAGRAWLQATLFRLPPETGRCVAQEIEALDGLQLQIAQLEKRIRERTALTPAIQPPNVAARHRPHPAWKTKYVCQIYDQVSQRKGHAIAVGAVARHLAEGAFWILKRQQPYRPPASRQAPPH